MTDSSPTPTPPTEPVRNDWAKATLWIVVVVVVALNAALFVRSCRNLPGEALDKTGRIIEKAGKALSDVASAFHQGRITTEFISYATTVSNQHYFQFATLKQTEIFTRTEAMSTAFGYVPLPEVVVEARAPVDYTYHLDLKHTNWTVTLKDDVVYVLAPPIRFNKPAVDASRITYEVKKGYLKSDEALENLKQSITSLSVLRARENIPLIRENGRRQMTEFVERWLLKSFSDGKHYSVRVFFPDEKPPEGITARDSPLP
jgi:hypothetical protein